MREITLEELLEAGCHFGHQVTRQNPKARDFVFEARDNIHIIDLAKTKEGLDAAAQYLKNLAKQNGVLVVVGSKRQASPIILKQAKRIEETLKAKNIEPKLFTVTNRWIGGTLTNSGEVVKNYKKLHDLEDKLRDDFEKEKYTKKEIGMWEKERQKLEMYYGGISDIKGMPSALFIVDTHLESLAVREAIAQGIPTVGMVDTNADPNVIDYPIPANDDAVGSIELIVTYIADAWIEGRIEAQKAQEEKAKEEAKAQEKLEKEKAEAVKESAKVKEEAVKKEEKAKKVSKTKNKGEGNNSISK